MGTVLYLSGTTRGATLEGIGRSLAVGFEKFGIEMVEASLRDPASVLETLKGLGSTRLEFVLSWVGMGMDFSVNTGENVQANLWDHLGIPFVTVHGDSPAYFFDRHVVRNGRYVSLYGFTEHSTLRRRLPLVRGMVEALWGAPVDLVPREEMDFKAKKESTLIFLKNGRDPATVRQMWANSLDPRMLRAILEIAAELVSDLDSPASLQIDDVVGRYFRDAGYDIEAMVKMRLFFIAQLDDYLRAVKCTRVAEALMDFPVEIRGNNWGHLDFSGKKVKYIDECDYQKSKGLIRGSLGILDMSPNTSSRPHDRVLRSYGAHTICLTNEQAFLEPLPHQDRLSFRYEKAVLQDRIAWILDHKAEAVDMGVAVAETYAKLHPPEQSAQTMLDCAAMARLNGLPNRPPGSQDFFVWPPAAL